MYVSSSSSTCSHHGNNSGSISSDQFSSVTQSCPSLCDPMDCSTPDFPVHRQLSEFTHTHVHWVSDAIQSSHPLLSPSPPALNLSQHQGLFNESVLRIRWPKYWSFSFSISPSNEHPGLIFRMDWLDLLAVQRTLKSLLQCHSSKASILCCSAFFIVQLSHPYMTPGKTIALTRQTFVSKVMSLLFNKLSRLVIAFLSRSKRLLIVIIIVIMMMTDNYWDLTLCQAWHAVGHLILRTVSWMRTGFRSSLWDGEKHGLERLNNLSKVIALAPWLSQPCIPTLSVSSTAPPS